jgi:hypothetical protein
MNPIPTKHVEFDTPALLTAWRDEQPAGTEILNISYHNGKQVCYYRPPVAQDASRSEIVQERVTSHLNASAKERELLGYSGKLLDKPVAQYSLIRNSLRNLKCFRSLSPQEITTTLDQTLRDLGFTILESYQGKSLYGTSSRMVVSEG